ncbi:YcxB family protein [Rhizobium sp. BK377]|uniref:YcxB family protein n=1 Tax=Rhizobium sp. BK377 TaxID=2587058 RepID=UPI00161F24F0|nr:YcxB family protein [Rhizobium sp. BK377]MBB3461364.1 hypothetical protein [Rhizobium sp. BK377]
MFQITYTMTSQDYAAMTRALTRRPLPRSILTLALWLFSVWCLIVFLTDTYDPVVMARAIFASTSSVLISAAVFVAITVFSIFSHWFAWAIAFLYYRQIASADATVTMTMSEAVVEASSTVADTKAPWSTVKRVLRERDYLFLAISKREAFILPRRSFGPEARFDAACRYAEARVGKEVQEG